VPERGIRCARALGLEDKLSTDANTRSAKMRTPAQAALVVGALGVVFGDIGTSPLYTIQTVFNPDDPHPVTAATETPVRRQGPRHRRALPEPARGGGRALRR
jgi:hypothetical protein